MNLGIDAETLEFKKTISEVDKAMDMEAFTFGHLPMERSQDSKSVHRRLMMLKKKKSVIKPITYPKFKEYWELLCCSDLCK